MLVRFRAPSFSNYPNSPCPSSHQVGLTLPHGADPMLSQPGSSGPPAVLPKLLQHLSFLPPSLPLSMLYPTGATKKLWWSHDLTLKCQCTPCLMDTPALPSIRLAPTAHDPGFPSQTSCHCAPSVKHLIKFPPLAPILFTCPFPFCLMSYLCNNTCLTFLLLWKSFTSLPFNPFFLSSVCSSAS